MQNRCEECEIQAQQIHCKHCIQNICVECDTKIHNKSKRAQHIRVSLNFLQPPPDKSVQVNSPTCMSTSSINSQDDYSTNDINIKSVSIQSDRLMDFQNKKQRKQIKLNVDVQEFKVQQSKQVLPFQQPEIQQPYYSESNLVTNQQQYQFPNTMSCNNINPQLLNKTLLQKNPMLSSQEMLQPRSSSSSSQQIQANIPLLQQFQRMDKQSIIVQTILMLYASNGDLLVLWDTFIESLREELLKQQENHSIEEILQNTIDLYHQTMRKFGNTKPIFYISLKLNYISIQGITWILKSIQKDHMTPSEKLIYSRIKECFGYKLLQNEWNQIINYLHLLQQSQQFIDFNHIEIPKLYLQKTKDCMNNSEFFLIFFKDQEWIIHDQGPVKYEDKENWNNFLDFINDFFREDKNDLWITSVMNIHSYDLKKSIVKPPKSVTRAIPGGRYGCAQMLKQCGPNLLKALSLGKLSMFVQEAITEGLLIYYKTLLIKGDLDQNSKNKSQLQVGDIKAQRILWVKTIIIEILKQNKQGISLARLPKLIQKRVNFNFDIQDLGFLKLKNLLKTIDGVWIENDGTTYACAFFNQTNFNINHFMASIKEIIKSIVEANITGITGEKLYFDLTVQLGHSLDIKAFNSDNFSEFLIKYAHDICEVRLINQDDKFHYMVYPFQNNAFNKILNIDTKQKQQLPQFYQPVQQPTTVQSSQNYCFSLPQQNLPLQQPFVRQDEQFFSNDYQTDNYCDQYQQNQIKKQKNVGIQQYDQNMKFIEDLLNDDDQNYSFQESTSTSAKKQQSCFHQDLLFQNINSSGLFKDKDQITQQPKIQKNL